MNAKLSTVTKTLVILIALALGVSAELSRALASILKTLLVFLKLSLSVMLNKKKNQFKKNQSR
jgi:hypothetical protein